MGEINIAISSFDFICILEMECIKQLNEHATLKIKGLVSEENAAQYKAEAIQERWVTVELIDETQKKTPFFCGILIDMHIQSEGQLNTLYLTLVSGSYLLDIVPHIRSFQREGYTYYEILKDCLSSDNGKVIFLEQKEKEAEHDFLQYRETNWSFMKRLAGHAQVALIPEDTIPGPKVYWGYKHKKIDINSEDFIFLHDYENFEIMKNAGEEDILTEDCIECTMTLRENYEIGITVCFKGHEWVIGKVASRFSNYELIYTYTLFTKKRGRCIFYNNDSIKGMSLKAIVKKVNGTKVQVEICMDENKANAGNKWFDFATVYSSPDGTGWYCMPEIGDDVRLTFPDSGEQNAYVASCIHLEGNGRCNPEEKSWKNRHGKEIVFSPTALLIRNNQGMSIELRDDEGIKIISNKKIVFQADGDINMSSQSGGIKLSSPTQIAIRQEECSIIMNNDMKIEGGKIYMN